MNSPCVAHLLNDIPFTLDREALLKRARLKPGSANADELVHLAAQAEKIARPKALYLVAYRSDLGEDWVELEGFPFTSRVLRVNLDHAYRVFPYLATCGQELQVWVNGLADMLHQFWGEAIKEMALTAALRALNEHLQNTYQPGETSSMSSWLSDRLAHPAAAHPVRFVWTV